MRCRPAAILLLCAAWPAAAQERCGAAGLSPTERMVCTDPVLAERELTLQRLYADRGGDDGLDLSREGWAAERDRCGSDIFCIERAYDERIGALSRPLPAPASDLRPWCGATRLNPTERAVCSDPLLADLDAALAAVYGSVRADDGDAEQQRWLREDRDTCGPARDCIAASYLRRITGLGRRLRDG